MNWKEKDKKVRDVLVKRLSILREKGDETLRRVEQRCKLKEANDVFSFIKAIDDCLDLIRFTNYGYSDFEIKDYYQIEEKQREMFEILERIEKTMDINEKNLSFIFHIKNAKIMVDNLKNSQGEIKSLIMALIPPKKENNDLATIDIINLPQRHKDL